MTVGTSIREFEPDDIPQVVALRRRSFRKSEREADADMAAYFRLVFFENPWQPSVTRSLVQVRAGVITGFLGLVPRPWTLNGRALRGATATELMVSREAGALAAMQLLRRAFDSDHDLLCSDVANLDSTRLWRRMGGMSSLCHSLIWIRPLQPVRHYTATIARNSALKHLRRAAFPLWRGMDALLQRFSANYHFRYPPIRQENLTPVLLAQGYSTLATEYGLQPVLDSRSAAWLLERLQERSRHGSMRQVGILDTQGASLLGWYIYYHSAGGSAEVVHMCARKDSRGVVIGSLLADAQAHGASVVTGRLAAPWADDLAAAGAGFYRSGPWTLIHSHDVAIRQAFLSGDAMVSRMDGEWWMTF
jgi:hypothetical protein